MDKQTPIHTGPWHILTRIINVECPDGRMRSVKITGQPDTAFTVPGSTSCKGKTVSGYVWMKDGRYLFTTTGKNAEVMGDWKWDQKFIGILIDPTGEVTEWESWEPDELIDFMYRDVQENTNDL